MRPLSAILASILLFSGCVSTKQMHIYAPGNETSRLHISLREVVWYARQKETISPDFIPEIHRDTKNYESFRIFFPSRGMNGQVQNLVSAQYIKSRQPGKKKLVIIPPIYGSSAFPGKMMASYLTHWNHEEDTNVVLINGETDIFDWNAFHNARDEREFWIEIEHLKERFRSSVIDILDLLDYFEMREEIDPKRIGVVGFSLGAMVANVVASLDSRIKTSALIMSAANLHEMFEFCVGRDAVYARKGIRKNLGWSGKDLREKTEEVLAPINPVRLSANIDPRSILIIDAAYDDYIPQSARDDLWQALGKPTRISLNYAHKMSFAISMTALGSYFTERTVLKFFKEKL
jgi:dienelactone hydrolase